MRTEYFPTVVQVVVGPDKTVFAYFSDGRIAQLDMKENIAAGGAFERLADDSFFVNALTVLNGTVAWDVSGHFDPGICIDIDPFITYEARRVADPLEGVAQAAQMDETLLCGII